MNPWIQTHCGIAFDLVAPTPDMVDLEDIAHALAHLTRYTGHAKFHYSVAEHSILVWQRVCELGGDRQTQRQALAHDFAEAYVGDLSSPMKRLLGDSYRSVERRVWKAVADKFGLAPTMHWLVRQADVEMLMTEARELLGPTPKDWGIPVEPLTLADYEPIGWPPSVMKRRLLDLWEGLQ